VRYAAFSPDGLRIVTASDDATARIWDAVIGKEITRLQEHSNWVLTAIFSHDGRHVLTASEDGTAKLWAAEPIITTDPSLIERAKRAVPRCLTEAQRKQYFLELSPPRWCIDLHKWPYDAGHT
jgi:WD40 repeat protein